MLDLNRLQHLKLHRVPPGQVFFAKLLRLDYATPPRTEIVLEGAENLPRDRSVFLAMNHTDKFNYWPLQYTMHHMGLRYTATWVKGKYYESTWTSRFLDSMNNIPLPSRGYVLTTLFRATMKRTPEAAEYRYLRDLVDSGRVPEQSETDRQSAGVQTFLATAFPPAANHGLTPAEAFLQHFDAQFSRLVDAVVDLNRRALRELDLNILVFPQGTRSLRLSKGHTGLVQMAMHLGAAIVPVGCNGSDRAYPGNSPVSKGGRIVYRIGTPLELDGPELAPFRIPVPFQPLSREVSRDFGPQLRGATDVLMERINDLLDPPYQWAQGQVSDGVAGMQRFL